MISLAGSAYISLCNSNVSLYLLIVIFRNMDISFSSEDETEKVKDLVDAFKSKKSRSY